MTAMCNHNASDDAILQIPGIIQDLSFDPERPDWSPGTEAFPAAV